MSMTDLNASVGIDAGSHTSKISYGGKKIAGLEGFNLLKLREESEVFFDEPVFSCVIALPESLTGKQHGDIIFDAKKSGFKKIDLITSHEAMAGALNENARVIVYDFGASKSDIIIFDENKKILDNEVFNDISGNKFDDVFAQWLSERFTLNLIEEKILLCHAGKIKINLSFNDFVIWRDICIMRDDFERLIYFTVKRALHTVERFIDCYSPKKIIMTGGCSEIPLIKKIFSGLNIHTEFNADLIAQGAALKARSFPENRRAEKTAAASKILELRGKLIELEELLTRRQKDRLYFLFKKAEGIFTNDPALITLMENLIKEIRNES